MPHKVRSGQGNNGWAFFPNKNIGGNIELSLLLLCHLEILSQKKSRCIGHSVYLFSVSQKMAPLFELVQFVR